MLDYFIKERSELSKNGETFLINMNNDKKIQLSQYIAERINIVTDMKRYRDIFKFLRRNSKGFDDSPLKTSHSHPVE